MRVGDQIVCTNKTDTAMWGNNDIHIGGIYTIASYITIREVLYYGIVNDQGNRCTYNSTYFVSARKEKLKRLYDIQGR